MSFINPKNWPIMVKLSVAMLAASLIPAVFITYFNLSSSMATVQKTEYRNLELLASSTADRLDQLMLDNGIAASQLSSDSDVIALLSAPDQATDALRQSVSGWLFRVLATNPQYEFVYLLDQKGNVIISRQLASVPNIQGQNFSNQGYFTEAMKGDDNIDGLVGPANKNLGFYFAAPVFSASEQIVGVSVIELQGTAVTDIVNNFKSGVSGFAFLVDQEGIIVSSPEPGWNYHSLGTLSRNNELAAGQRFMLTGCKNPQELDACKVDTLNLPGLSAVINSGTNPRNAIYKSPTTETNQFVGIANTKQLHWSVVVSVAEQEFTASLTSLKVEMIVSVIVISLLAIILGILLARVITQPLDKLAFAAESVEKGGTFQPERLATVLAQVDEIGHLARTFSAMSEALIARVAELRTVNRVSRKISSSIDIANSLTLVLNSLKNVIPYDRASVLLYNPQKEEFSIRAYSDQDGYHLLNADAKPAIQRRNAGHLSRFFRSRSDTNFTMLMPNVRPIPEDDAIFNLEWGNFEPKSYLGVPLQSSDQIFGVIELGSAEAGKFTIDHERVLELIAVPAAIAVHNALDVEQREADLQKQIDELKIVIDETKKQKYVSEIVGSDFFQSLTEKARMIREQRGKHSDTENK